MEEIVVTYSVKLVDSTINGNGEVVVVADSHSYRVGDDRDTLYLFRGQQCVAAFAPGQWQYFLRR